MRKINIKQSGGTFGLQSIENPFNKTVGLAGTRTTGPTQEQERKLNAAYTWNGIKSSLGNIFGGSGGNAGGQTMNLSGLSTGLGFANSLAASFVNPQEDTSYGEQQAIGNIISNFNPIIGGAYNLLSSISEGTKLNANTMSKEQKDRSNVGWFGNLVNKAGSLVPFAGALSKKTDQASISMLSNNLRGAFTGALNDMDTDVSMSGKRYLVGGKDTNKNIAETNKRDRLLTALGLDTNNIVSSVPYVKEQKARQNYRKWYDIDSDMPVGKNGMKLLSKEELTAIYNKHNITKFQEGGSIMIPDGALHAHKHHMEDVNPELAEDLTKKGIPVITEGDGGEITQVAEVEKEEAILSKPLTEQIESLWKDGSEEAMIEAGKLIVEALFTDTVDNSGIIDKVE